MQKGFFFSKFLIFAVKLIKKDEYEFSRNSRSPQCG